MDEVETASVALVVTSPPYFAGKEYETSLGQGGVPASYLEYLALLRDVFAECGRVLEPGGRIAVNVANLGRRPFRSLAGDVTGILGDLGLLLRGEVVWWKGRAAGGSCAWGTFLRPANPVLRDVTERIVIASKGRFDRAVAAAERQRTGLPSVGTISRDEFLEATTDLWELPPESARRVGHPAPFPVELPQRLIELYTYRDDVVLDPFMGSGSTAVAALRTGRHYLGYDTDASYVTAAEARLAAERRSLAPEDGLAAGPSQPASALTAAAALVAACGFTDLRRDVKIPRSGLEVSWLARDRTATDWAFDLTGGFTAGPSGLRRTDTLWKALGRAAVLHELRPDLRLVLLSTSTPAAHSPARAALAAVTGPDRPVFDVVQLGDPAGEARLRAYADGHG
jgi:site-specific DNA-methyltransferase (adenine-specific)